MNENKCYCLIPHPSRAAFMLVKQGESWVLPTLRYSGDWTDLSFPEINKQILVNFGLETTVLRRLQRGDNFLMCEMEVHSRKPDVFFEARWYDRENHKNSGGLGSQADEVLEKWFEDADSNDKPVSRPPWEYQGWFKEASEWIKQTASRNEFYVTGPVKQIRADAITCLMSVQTIKGDIFFKSSAGGESTEALLTREIAQRWPDQVFPLIEIEPTRNWMLITNYRAFASVSEASYTKASNSFARLLIESADSVSEWEKLNCRDYSLQQLEAFSKKFPDMTDAVRFSSIAMKEEDIERLVNNVKDWGGLCSSLSDFAIPETLGNLNFKFKNIAFSEGDYLIFDWQETAITHPFFCLLNMFEHFSAGRNSEPENGVQKSRDELIKMSIQSAFLEPFSQFESAQRLEEAFVIATSIQPLVRLKRQFEYLDQVEKNSFWERELLLNLNNWCRYYASLF